MKVIKAMLKALVFILSIFGAAMLFVWGIEHYPIPTGIIGFIVLWILITAAVWDV